MSLSLPFVVAGRMVLSKIGWDAKPSQLADMHNASCSRATNKLPDGRGFDWRKMDPPGGNLSNGSACRRCAATPLQCGCGASHRVKKATATVVDQVRLGSTLGEHLLPNSSHLAAASAVEGADPSTFGSSGRVALPCDCTPGLHCLLQRAWLVFGVP